MKYSLIYINTNVECVEESAPKKASGDVEESG